MNALGQNAVIGRTEEWSRWDQLRKLGSSPLVRSSLVFATAGYLLLWNDKFQEFLSIRFDSHLSLWRIWMLYYGGMSVAIATGLYSSICPKPVKDYPSAFSLAQSECQHMATMGLGPKHLEDVRALEASCNMTERSLWPPDRPRDTYIEEIRGTSREAEGLASLIVYAWRLHNIRHPWTRRGILLLYSFGFVLLGIPAAVTFVQVTLVGLGLSR